MDMTIGELGAIVKAIADRLEPRFAKIDQRLDALETEMRNGVSSRLSAIEGRLTSVEGRLTNVEGRLTSLETTVGIMQDQMDGMATTLAEVHAAAVPDAK